MKLYLKNGGLLLIFMVFGVAGFIGNLSASGNIVETTSMDQTNLAITVYNDGTGLVKDTRNIDLPSGTFNLKFMDVSSNIDATSVRFVSNTNADSVTVLEQNYEYDLVSSSALYENYIDKPITVVTSDGETVVGTLLGYESGMGCDRYYEEYYFASRMGFELPIPPSPLVANTNPVVGLIIQTEDGIKSIGNMVEVRFDALPEGLITRPTLKWELENSSPGTHECEMSYLTSGISWKVNYVAIVGRNDDVLDLSGWVTINNMSGASFYDAVLKLVAGEVNRVSMDWSDYQKSMMMCDSAPAECDEEGGFVEESFFEYHLYTLQRPATVMNNQQKQISLLESNGVGVEKILVFNPRRGYYSAGDTFEGTIGIRLQFMNEEENGLGIPLPKGILRVFKEDSSGQLQFIGEDRIDHTPKDEEIDVYLGEAFDIVGERTVSDRRHIGGNVYEYDVSVTIRNHKTTPIEILYWDYVYGDWEVTSSTLDFEKKDARTIEFVIPVESDGETVLEYTIRR